MKVQSSNFSFFKNPKTLKKTSFGNQNESSENQQILNNNTMSNVQQSTNMVNQLLPFYMLTATSKNPNPFLFLALANTMNNNNNNADNIANTNDGNNSNNNDLYKMAFLYHMMTN